MSSKRPSAHRSTAHGSVVAPVAASMVLEAAARGLAQEPLLARLGLSPSTLRDPERRVPFEALYGVWADCMRALRDPGLPLSAARRVELEDYTALGFAVTTASTVRAAVNVLVQFGHFVADGCSWTLEERSGDGVRLRWQRAGVRTLGHRVANECAVAEVLQVARRIVGGPVVPTAVAFLHPPPPKLDAHVAFFGVRPRFGASWEGLELPRAVLEQAPRQSNPALAAWLEKQLVSTLAARPFTATVSERIARLLEQDLAAGEPQVGAVARALAISERTLRRQLQREHLTFRGVWQSVRQRRAEALLASGKVTLDEAAFLTGFSELSAFARAFKRWTGETPGAWRARAPDRAGQEVGRPGQ